MKTPLGIDKDTNEIRLIEDVESGLKCNCICPACRTPLVARKGPIKADHFSHHHGTEGQACRETAVHLMAKYVILHSPQILFPKKILKSAKKKTLLRETISHESPLFDQPQEIYECREEIYLPEHKIKPDILCKTKVNETPFGVAIEIAVTHLVDDAKLDKLKEADLTTFEIDLADLADQDEISFDQIKNALCEPYRLRWIYFSKSQEDKLKEKLQRQTNTEQIERNSVIKEWSNQIKYYFLERGSISTPAYHLTNENLTPTVKTIDGKNHQIQLPPAPNLKQSFAISTIEDVKEAILVVNIVRNNTTYPLPITINLPSNQPGSPIGSHLEIKSDELPSAEDFERLLSWKKSIKIQNYIEEVKETKKQLAKNLNEPIRENAKRHMEWLRSIRRLETQPDFSSLNKIQRDYINALDELTRKGFYPERYTINLTDGWILGCPNEYWQTILIQAICRIDNNGVDAKYYTDYLKKRHGIVAIEPIHSLTFMKSALTEMNYNTEEIPNTYKLLIQYFKHIESMGLIKWKGRGNYQKLVPYGSDYKAL